jgi:PAS domain S-box-containing protein
LLINFYLVEARFFDRRSSENIMMLNSGEPERKQHGNAAVPPPLVEQIREDLIDLLPDFVIVLDVKDTIVEWNQQAERILGYSRAATMGQKLAMLLATDSFTQQSLELMQNQLKETGYWEGEVALKLKDKDHAWFFIRARQIMLGGHETGTLLVSTYLADHEVRHHLAQAALDYSQKELGSILSAVGDMVCAYDLKEEHLAFISPSCQRLTGYSEYEFMDTPHLFWEIIVPQERELVLNALRSVQPNQTISVEYSIHRRGGEKRWVLNNMTPITDGDGAASRIICAITDTTAYRELNELKSRMMRMASHDLNNPLSTAVGFFSLLIDDLREILTEGQQKMVASVERAHQRMAEMLEELLSYEQIASQESLKMEPVNLIDLISIVLDEFTMQARNKQHSLTFDPGVGELWVGAEAIQVHHALENYVSNAIKYTPPGGKIVVRAFREGERVIVEVTDNGYGVDEVYRDNLFEPFFRSKQAGTEHIHGTGIGLSLVKSVVKNHGGDVFYRPETGGGSTFGLWLPVPS